MINVEEICRLCLKPKSPGMILLEINEIQQSKFEEITRTELILQDDFPCKCCSECRDQMENFFFYKNQLLRKQQELLQVLKLNTNSNKTQNNKNTKDKPIKTHKNDPQYEYEIEIVADPENVLDPENDVNPTHTNLENDIDPENVLSHCEFLEDDDVYVSEVVEDEEIEFDNEEIDNGSGMNKILNDSCITEIVRVTGSIEHDDILIKSEFPEVTAVEPQFNEPVSENVFSGSGNERIDDEFNDGSVNDEFNDGSVNDEFNDGSANDKFNDGSVNDEFNDGSDNEDNDQANNGLSNENYVGSRKNYNEGSVTDGSCKRSTYRISKRSTDGSGSAKGSINGSSSEVINAVNNLKAIGSTIESTHGSMIESTHESTDPTIPPEDESGNEEYLDDQSYFEPESESESQDPPAKVPRRDELEFLKPHPRLILNPDFLQARENLKNRQLSKLVSEHDYKTVDMFDGTVLYVCNFVGCKADFQSLDDMKTHVIDHKENGIIAKCPKCPQTFRLQHFYDKHIEKAHSGLRQICQICGKTFTERTQLRSHMRNHDKTLKYACDFEDCVKAFRYKHHLDNHMRRHTKESPFECTVPGCNSKFRQKHALTVHMRKHNGVFLTCQKCDSPFLTNFQLQKHLQQCNGSFKPLRTRAPSKKQNQPEDVSDMYTCCIEDCQQSFKAKVTLEKHLRRVHEIAVTVTTCVLCCQKFPTVQALKAHQRLHLPFSCMLCSLNFKSKDAYENHVSNHNSDEVRSHQCPECHASFKRSEHLRAHVINKHSIRR